MFHLQKLKRKALTKWNEAWKAQVDKFLSKNKRLFDIFCEDKNPEEGLEKKYVVPMKHEDWDYLK